MTPRVGIALAGAGALIAIGGAIGIGGDQLTDDDGDLQRIPGVVVALLLIAAGLAVLHVIRTGPLATAGASAVAAGIPMLLLFATVNDDDFPFFAFDALLLVSTVAWLVAHLVGPGRGRLVFLVLALVAAPLFVMEQVESISDVPAQIGEGFSQMFDSAASSSGSASSEDFTFDENGELVFPDEGFPDEDFGEGTFEDDVDSSFEPDLPDPSTLGLIAAVFGLVYVLASHVLTRRGYDGTASPLGAVGGVLLAVAVAFLTDDLREIGSGIVLVVLGLGVLAVGAAGARRFTTWFGAALVAQGVLVLVGEALGDGASTLVTSTVFLLTGIGVVCIAHLVATFLAEPDEEDELRSLTPRTRREPGTGPALDDEAVVP
ncbi:MAG TPA: hypothetical protein VFU93_10560 [Acidimicrobiales bacterium]|nr:hypothetical protein [Acidimicrobiales bacterium]